jgi:hypothetical protein
MGTTELEEYTDYTQQVCNKYKVISSFDYKTVSILGPHTIQVSAGEVLHRIVDEPINFSNGITIIPEHILESNPHLFEPIWEDISQSTDLL